MSFFTDKTVLITGGTGSMGKALVGKLLSDHPDMRKLIVYSRDEQKQYWMADQYPKSEYPNLRFLIGDVRDVERLKRAFLGVDVVIHCAAMKHVPSSEYNPMECVKTNVLGSENIINAALATSVSTVVALSTDKAAAPINLYGATKLCADKLFVAANNIKGDRDLKFSVVRYGNVMGSNGSVVPLFLKKKEEGVLPLTHPEMTRFSIQVEEAMEMVLWACENSWGGEIWVPKIPSYRLTDLAEAVAPECEHKLVGIRQGEKVHEDLITQSDAYSTYDCGKYYAILPVSPVWSVEAHRGRFNSVPVPKDFKYDSEGNEHFLSIDELRTQVNGLAARGLLKEQQDI